MVQLIPSGDDFSDTIFAAQAQFWGRFYGGVLSVAGNYKQGWIHDAYALETIISTPGVPPITPGAVTYSNPDADELTKTRGFIWRRKIATGDHNLQLNVQLAQFLGFTGIPLGTSLSSAFTAMLEWGIMARIIAGTLAGSPGVETRYEDLTCYFLQFTTASPNIDRFSIWRYTAGVGTELIRHDLPVGGGIAFTEPLSFRFRVVDVAGDPTLEAYLGPFKIQPTLTTIGEVQLFKALGVGDTITNLSGLPLSAGTLTDNSASKILAPSGAHAGFSVARDRTVTALTPNTEVVDVLNFFAVEEIGNAVLLVEQFDPIYPSDGLDKTDGLGASGNIIQSDWTWDQFGEEVEAERDAAGKAVLKTAGGTIEIALSYQRPAPDPRNQRRTGDIDLTTTGTQPTIRRAGIFLRGRAFVGASHNLVRGYLAYCQVLKGTPDVLKVRISQVTMTGDAGITGDPMTNEVVLAEVVDAGLFSEGVEFEMDFQVVLHPESATFDGPAVLTLRIDSTQVVLVLPSSPTAGVSVDGSGTVTDASSTRVEDGPIQGFYYSSEGFWYDVKFDDWAEVSVAPPGTPPQDQLSISVLDEGTATTSIDSVLPESWPVTITHEYRGTAVPFESGHIQTWPKSRKKRQLFGVRVDAATEAQKDALDDFFRDRKGPTEAFNYSPIPSVGIAGVAVRVHLVRNSFRWEKRGPDVYFLEFEMRELVV